MPLIKEATAIPLDGAGAADGLLRSGAGGGCSASGVRAAVDFLGDAFFFLVAFLVAGLCLPADGFRAGVRLTAPSDVGVKRLSVSVGFPL